MARRSVLSAFILLAASSWWLYCANYVSDDSYFYLVIAHHLAATGRQTFSGLFPTNGVHPLWTYLLAGYTFVVAHLHPTWVNYPRYAVPLSAALLAIGAFEFLKAARILRLNPLWLVYLPLGFITFFGVLYSEAHLFYAALGLLTRLSVDGTLQRRWGPACLGAAAAAVFLARLDSILFVACVGVWVLWSTRSVARTTIFAAVFAALALPYLLSNILFFGGLVPISGWMKSSFPHVYLRGFEWHGLSSTLLGYNIGLGIVPIIVSLPLLARARRVAGPGRSVAVVYLGGSIFQFLYVALFTRSHTAWYWYYVLPVILGGFSLAVGWREWQLRLVEKSPGGERWLARLGTAVAIVLGGAWIAATLASRWREQVPPGEVRVAMRYLAEQHVTSATVLISDFPGYLTYVSPDQIVAADMLTSNRLFYKRMRATPNALAFLQDEFRRQGHPLRLIVWNTGCPWLVPDRDLRGITYNDPRTYPVLTPIGHLRFNKAPAVTEQKEGHLYSAVWDLVDD